MGGGKSFLDLSGLQQGLEIGQAIEPAGKERRFGAGAVEGVRPVRCVAGAGHPGAMHGRRHAIKRACGLPAGGGSATCARQACHEGIEYEDLSLINIS